MEKYESLPQGEEDADERPLLGGTERKVASVTTLGRWCTLAILASTGFNALFIAYSMFFYHSASPEYKMHDLEYRSTYVGFDSLYSNKSYLQTSYHPVINHPRIMTTVNSQEPNKLAQVWPNNHLTSDGYVPIAERRLTVSDHVSTIAQYRVMDYGMESCKMVIEPPALNTTDVKNAMSAMISSGNGDNAILDVWILDADHKLDFRKLSWNTKPKRKGFLGQLHASYGTKYESHSFPCAAGSYQTFEVTCSGCQLDIMRFGWRKGVLFLLQSQTL